MSSGGALQMESSTTQQGIHAKQSKGRQSSGFTAAVICLRIVQVVLAGVAMGVMASNTTSGSISDLNYDYNYTYGNTYDIQLHGAKFSFYKAFTAVVVVSGIVFAYAIVQVVVSCATLACRNSCLSSLVAACLIFFLDLILAIALAAVTGWAAYIVGHLASKQPFCSTSNLSAFKIGVFVTFPTWYCVKILISVTASFFAFVFLVVTAIMYLGRLGRSRAS